jgi:hypothetical protein
MSFSEMPKEVILKIVEGQDLFLQARIPNRIVRKFALEVRFLQLELDAAINRFNKRIVELEGRRAPKVDTKFAINVEKKKEVSDDERLAIKKIQEEKKKGGLL